MIETPSRCRWLAVVVLSSVGTLSFAQGGSAPSASMSTRPATAGASTETLLAMCTGCHGIRGYQASFPDVHRVPKISGQNAKYIESALKAYRDGQRKHPTMRGISANLDDEGIARIANYYAEHGEDRSRAPAAANRAPSPRVADLLKRGDCASCHGADFTSPIDPGFPKLAGQYADYLNVALGAYTVEGSPLVGRAHPVMSAIAKQFTNAELKAMSDYIGSLQTELTIKRDRRLR